jgi:hypothetical protein
MKKSSTDAHKPCSVRLPYSLVPGIDFSSVAYRRVLATLAKQVHNDSKHEMVICSESSSKSDVVPMDLGMFIIPFIPLFQIY